MTNDRRANGENPKPGGQRPPQVLANTRSTNSHSEKQTDKHAVVRNRDVRMRIENDLYERQSN